ncbi:MAG: phosphoglyceromutase [Acidobacteria bacterium]|nr:phosphoglyceromutase [Acidobacteriota bacterium]
MIKRLGSFTLTVVLLSALVVNANAQNKTENLILITLDGARLQEIFGGLDVEVLKGLTEEGTIEETPLYKKYWADTAEKRREKLMPFFWGVLMKQHGSIAGNRRLGSTVELTNKHWFSYPGYSEILTGQAHDEIIKSNDKIRNPNTTVLEFLKRKLRLDVRQVAAFASWDVIDWVVEHEVGAITSNAGFEAYQHPDAAIDELSKLQFETATPWDNVRHDIYTFRFAMAHLKTYQPRVLYIALGETDDWAHNGRYDRVLQVLERTDAYLRQLWEFLQSQEQYKNRTTILITVDHGRGSTAPQWKTHGKKIAEAKYTWLAVVSPDSQRRGEWVNTETIFANQIAATLCRFLKIDYSENNANAGKPIAQLFKDN